MQRINISQMYAVHVQSIINEKAEKTNYCGIPISLVHAVQYFHITD